MFIDDVVTLIQGAGLGVPGVTIFWTAAAKLPANPTPANPALGPAAFFSLTETGGTAPWILHTGAPYDRPSCQIMTRGPISQPGPARTLIESAYIFFRAKVNFSVNGVPYVSIFANQAPFELSPDENPPRIRFAFNIRGVKR